jgi:hypothetical protein
MSRADIVEHLKMGPTPPKVFAKFLKAMELRRGLRSGRKMRLPVRINRKGSVALFPFTDYFKGFEKVAAVRSLFGERTERVLEQLKVEFINVSFLQMIPSDDGGHLLVGVSYLKGSDSTSIYLDILLCLNLLKRASEGRKYRSRAKREFWDTTALLKSYKAMLEEARQIELPDAKVMEHLGLPRFMMSPADYEMFLRKLGIGKA